MKVSSLKTNIFFCFAATSAPEEMTSDSPTSEPTTSDPTTAAVGASVGVLFFILLAVALGVFFWRRRYDQSQNRKEKAGLQTVKTDESGPKKTEAQVEGRKEKSWRVAKTSVDIPQQTPVPIAKPPVSQKSKEQPVLPFSDISLPPHLTLKKAQDLREKAKKMSENTAELEKEFKKMLKHVKENVSKERTVSSQEKNQRHNRYTDIGGYPTKSFAFDDTILSSFYF